MNHSHHRRLAPIVFAFLFAGAAFVPAARADSIKRVLIIPLTLHAEKDLSYLQQGISDMLASRLAQTGKVTVIGREETAKAVSEITAPLTDQSAAALGARYQADYVIFGSVTFFGDSLSTDARAVSVDQAKSVVRFSQAGQKQGDLIGHIDSFASQVNADVFGRKEIAAPPPAPAREAEERRQNPEKLLESETAPPSGPAAPQAGAPAVTPAHVGRRYKTEIIGLCVGDVDQDGQLEVVSADETSINVFRLTDAGLARTAEINEKSYNRFISLDVADINHNGKAEIYVTNLPRNQQRLESFVLEWNGKAFERIADKLQWYFRVIDVPDGDKVLMGQKRGTMRDTFGINSLFEGPAEELTWRGDQLEAGSPLHLPRGVNIYSFARGDVLNLQKQMIVSYNTSNFIHVLDQSGDELWTSPGSYGPTANYMEIPDSQDTKDWDRYYLPPRIRLLDPKHDGKLEMIVVKNEEKLTALSRYKSFKLAYLEGLAWDGLNFKSLWKTEPVPKYISDWAVADLDRDGHLDLVYAVVSKEKTSWNKGESVIVYQTLP
jgi:TolB-like protein